MGSAASVQESLSQQIPSEYKDEFEKFVLEQYENLKANGLNEQEIQEKLTTLTSEKLLSKQASIMQPKESTSGKFDPNLKNRRSSGPKPQSQTLDNLMLSKGSLKKETTKKTATRRRSFEQAPPSATRKSFGASPTATSSDSLTTAAQLTLAIEQAANISNAISSTSSVPPTLNQNARDNWDSASDQPFCIVCKTAFKSMGLLQKHEQYSVIHSQNLEKQKAAGNIELLPTASSPVDPGTPSSVPSVPSSSSPIPTPSILNSLAPVSLKPLPLENSQVEGQHFTLLYNGTKLFWRSQEDIEFSIYKHILAHCIEVIPYDLEKGRELSRMYFDHYQLSSFVEKDAKSLFESRRREILKEDRFAKVSDSLLTEDSERLAICNYILKRLQKAPGKDVSFQLDSNETFNCLLSTPPSVLKPVNVVRKRRTSTEEINSTISGLALDRKELAAATAKAEKIANLVHEGASLLQGYVHKYAHLNKWRRLWIVSIRRVIRIAHVARMTAYLETLTLRSAPASSSSSVASSSSSAASSSSNPVSSSSSTLSTSSSSNNLTQKSK